MSVFKRVDLVFLRFTELGVEKSSKVLCLTITNLIRYIQSSAIISFPSVITVITLLIAVTSK